MNFTSGLSHITTVGAKSKMLEGLEALLEALYKSKGNLSKDISEFLSYANKDALLRICEANNVKDSNIIALQELIQSFIEYVRSLETLNLTLAYDPSGEDVRAIYSWILSNVKHKVLLNITIDPTLVGGAVIEFGGMYKDFSLQQLLEIRSIKLPPQTKPTSANKRPPQGPQFKIQN